MSDQFEQYRTLLLAIAYRMLGSAMEAEDIVQEAYLRYQATPPDTIQSHKAFLTTIVTRLCLDQLKSARVQRETYIGPWLPEPVLTGGDGAYLATPAAYASQHESISMAFLVLLESLSPLERAVFLLREVFDYDYREIAHIVDREEAACRQLYSRAKKHIADNRPRFEPSPEAHQRILAEFMRIVENGEIEGLVNLLAEDVTWYSDGGGKVTAATKPIHGRQAVMDFIGGLLRLKPEGTTYEVAEINGAPGIMVRVKGRLYFIVSIESDGQQVRTIHAVANPDKLAHLAC
ncbi:MAG TPA: RNA polymerase sigma-70 factor [Spirillospora sp.]|nr:RNA polymerase sigma-70 factor [Spirillospora sp.]